MFVINARNVISPWNGIDPLIDVGNVRNSKCVEAKVFV